MTGFGLEGRVAVVTGGYGVLGGSMAEALGRAGARVLVLGRNRDAAGAKAEALQRTGIAAMALVADVLDDEALVTARTALLSEWGRVDILVNAAGGHVAEARTDHAPAFEMSLPAFEDVVRLNLHGTVYPTLVFGEAMARQRMGSSPTERARKILDRTPMGRFGDPAELQGPVLWLCSDAASFVTGAVVPVDGGFSADSGI
jgi:NAD(P)-dependent dehydrogenase (short-subunit alcohol dehydrogenase family)